MKTNINNTYKKVEEMPVWVKSHELTLEVYKLTKKFPKEEGFGLVSQLRRGISSIPANITEGYYKNSTKELIQFLYNARGSSGECLYHLRLAKDLKYITTNEYEEMLKGLNEVGKQPNGWIKSLKERSQK